MQLEDKNDTINMNRLPPLKCAATVSYKEGL